MQEVVPVLAEIARLHEVGGEPYLLYWQAVLQQCIGRIDPAISDFEAFLAAAVDDDAIQSLRADAEARLRRLRSGNSTAPTRPTGRRSWGLRAVIGAGAGWQLLVSEEPFHYLSVPLDLGIRLAGPAGLQVFVRPSVSGTNLEESGAVPEDPTVSWLAPFGVAATFGWPASVRPFVSPGVQLAVSAPPNEDPTLLVGAMAQVGAEIPLPATPLVLRPFVEPGSLAAGFTLRAGLQLGLDLGPGR